MLFESATGIVPSNPKTFNNNINPKKAKPNAMETAKALGYLTGSFTLQPPHQQLNFTVNKPLQILSVLTTQTTKPRHKRNNQQIR